jgi:hypothetical protein
MKKGAALMEIEDGDETPDPYFGRAASSIKFVGIICVERVSMVWVTVCTLSDKIT